MGFGQENGGKKIFRELLSSVEALRINSTAHSSVSNSSPVFVLLEVDIY